MNHKKLLMFCFHYPPAISGGVERSVRFARYLPEFGWSPVVVTTNRYGDDPGGVGGEVVRVGEFLGRADAARSDRSAPSRRGAAVRWVEKWLLIPDKHVRWTAKALIPALRMIRRGAGEVIYTTSPPVSAHVLGLSLKKLTGRPWVMDLRDPWTLEPLVWYLRAGGARLSIEKRIERLCIGNADAVVTTTPEAREMYAALYPRSAGRIHSIPNGYDARELEDARGSISSNDLVRSIGDQVFVIGHVGTFSRHADTDAYPRAFLDAVADLVREGVLSPRTHRIIFAGGMSPETRRRIAAYGLGKLILMTGPISHIDALRITLRADVLLLYDPGREGNYYVRGKLYEYLASERPILGVLPPGAARGLLERSGHAIAITRDDAREIGHALRSAVAARAAGKRTDFALSQYEGRHLTSLLAAVLDAVVR